MRVSAPRLVTISAFHHAANFECDTNLEVGLILELRDEGTIYNS